MSVITYLSVVSTEVYLDNLADLAEIAPAQRRMLVGCHGSEDD
jgi:hypothetical protein